MSVTPDVEMPPLVLVVDDSDDILDATRMVLELHGYQVLTAGGCNAALSLLRNVTAMPSLILLDLMMPVLSGWDLIESLRQDPRLASARVVGYSCDAKAEVRAEALGLAGFLKKPTDVPTLIATVDRHCRKRPV